MYNWLLQIIALDWLIKKQLIRRIKLNSKITNCIFSSSSCVLSEVWIPVEISKMLDVGTDEIDKFINFFKMKLLFSKGLPRIDSNEQALIS